MTVYVTQSRDTTYGDIQSKVWRFLGLMRWWLNTQSGTHSGTNFTRGECTFGNWFSVPTCAGCNSTEKNKMSVRILVEKLVSRTFNKARVNCTFGKPEITVKRFFEKIWAEVVDFHITSESFKNLEKDIFKDLCKK